MKKLLSLAISLIFISNLVFTRPTKLDTQEVEILEEIWEKVGLPEKVGWGSDIDPCSTLRETTTQVYVNCSCHFESNTTCHVICVFVKQQNLSTALPTEFVKLRHLQILDLSRNYLNGTIPSEWEKMKLTNLSLMGNRLSGPFPTTLTRMTTLLDLTIEGNRFSGPIPKEIANLKNLNKLVLSSNDFTGQIPVTLGELTNLTDLRISDNNFTGKIPNFISMWKKITRLHIQGCSFEGPFPSSISALTQLNDLRLSDMKRGVSTFPQLENMKNLKKLILRNCLINGTIPDYVGNLKYLDTLDLSFNNFTGALPTSFSGLGKAKYIYLASNNLTGPMPRWVLSSNKQVDVSCNRFTWDASGPKACATGFLNMVESYLPAITNNELDIPTCLQKDYPCTKSIKHQIYSLHINCGGNRTITYQDDTTESPAPCYFNSDGHWASCHTGNFLDRGQESDVHIIHNTTGLHNISRLDTELYTTARTAATSLTYYGLCLMNGNYNVTLNFAEIVFTQGATYTSLGKRVFDIYVQGELKHKDFDIVKEAGGTGRAVLITYPVNVKNNTLKIQLYWAGKGTTGIPSRGSYGPIISAISVSPNFKPPNFRKKVKVGIIAGSISGGLFLVGLVIVILWRKGYIMGGKTLDAELRGIDLRRGTFTLAQMKAATGNFDASNKLREGGFGCVYKGLLSDGTIIAIKVLSSKSKQGAFEFVSEIGILSGLEHPNLVRLYGCCVEKSQMILVYEYMENNSLSHALLEGDKASKAKLTWPVRLEICLGTARGLLYLHEEAHVKIIHRDIKADNVLLDENLNARISDFGLAKLIMDDKTQITGVAGTSGYMAPEYCWLGHLSSKADVYSFGVVLLEIVSGKRNYNPTPESIGGNSNDFAVEEEFFYLPNWAYGLYRTGNILQKLVDPDLGSEYSEVEILKIVSVALLCLHQVPSSRPTMRKAIDMLEGRTQVDDFIRDSGVDLKNAPPLWSLLRPENHSRRAENRPLRSNGAHTQSFVTELS